MRGEIRSEADYRQMLADQAASGVSLTEFARSKGVPYSTLAMWRIRLQGTRREQREGNPPNSSPPKTTRRKPKTGAPPQPELVPVRLELPTVPASSVNGLAIYSIEVVLRSGHVLRIPPGFDPEQALTLIRLLGSDGC